MRCSVFHEFHCYLWWAKCVCPEHILRASLLLRTHFSPELFSWQEERSRGKSSCPKEKEKGRKATLRLNTRGVLKLLHKRRGKKPKKPDNKYHRNPCLRNLLHNHKSWEWAVSKNCVPVKVNQSEYKEYFYLCPGVMLSSLTPDTEIEEINSALTWIPWANGSSQGLREFLQEPLMVDHHNLSSILGIFLKMWWPRGGYKMFSGTVSYCWRAKGVTWAVPAWWQTPWET